MNPYHTVFKILATQKAFLIEFNFDNKVYIFDGIRWELLNLKNHPCFSEWLPAFIAHLTPDIKLKHQNPVDWRVVFSFEEREYVCSYCFNYKSLRVCPSPSKKTTLEDWGFSDNQIKSLAQPGHISLVVGPQASGKSTVQKLLRNHGEQVGVQARLKSPQSFSTSPRLWYFGDEELLNFKTVLDLSFKGHSVCMGLESLDLEVTLLRFFEEVPEKFKTRIINQLTVIETRLLPGLEVTVVPFSSFYQLRYCPSAMIERQDWTSLLTWQEGQKDSLHIRTLNQVLLQGVIRRKIDVKTAFAASAHPEGLDHMLRRIGV
jgi:hypothetical protein